MAVVGLSYRHFSIHELGPDYQSVMSEGRRESRPKKKKKNAEFCGSLIFRLVVYM